MGVEFKTKQRLISELTHAIQGKLYDIGKKRAK